LLGVGLSPGGSGRVDQLRPVPGVEQDGGVLAHCAALEVVHRLDQPTIGVHLQAERLAQRGGGLLGALQRGGGEVDQVRLTVGEGAGDTPGHGAAPLGEPESWPPSVEHPIGIVDLTVPEQMDCGTRHGSSIANLPGCSVPPDVGGAWGRAEGWRRGTAPRDGRVSEPRGQDTGSRSSSAAPSVVKISPRRAKSAGLRTSTNRARTEATWCGAASASREKPASVSTQSTPRRSQELVRRATSPACSIRCTVWVSREREATTWSASWDIRRLRPSASLSRTSTSYSLIDRPVVSSRSRSRAVSTAQLPLRNLRQCSCCWASSHSASRLTPVSFPRALTAA